MWLGANCPVRTAEQTWIEQSLRWMVEQFGETVLRGTVVLPTDAFFPGSYSGSIDDVWTLLRRLCDHMAVNVERIEFDFVDDDNQELLANLPTYVSALHGAAGHYQQRAGRAVIAVRSAQARDPMALVATIAHELGHERLLGEGRISSSRPDHEPLTDLLTVFFGLGIFSANAAFEFSRRPGGWQSRRLGYLTEPMFGYSLAYYSWLRGDPDPDWSGYLDTNPRVYLKKGLKYLSRRHGRRGVRGPPRWGRRHTGRDVDACLWTTGSTAPPLAAESGLTVDPRGHIVVDATLRPVSHPSV
jgi:hypothetical protein